MVFVVVRLLARAEGKPDPDPVSRTLAKGSSRGGAQEARTPGLLLLLLDM